VLLLDEPFGALDAAIRHDLRRWLRGVHDATGSTTIFVTHDQEEAFELADRVVVMGARGKPPVSRRTRVRARRSRLALKPSPASSAPSGRSAPGRAMHAGVPRIVEPGPENAILWPSELNNPPRASA
jgi:sulfate/thiosulfate transport system ATP-binding protein